RCWCCCFPRGPFSTPGREERSKFRTSPDKVNQRANSGNCDPDFVPCFQRELIGRDNPGASQQKTAMREGIVPVKIVGERDWIALHGFESGRPRKSLVSVAQDRKLNLGRRR